MESENILTFDLFKGLNPDDMPDLLAVSEEEVYDKGQSIIEESSPSSDLYVLLSGKVNVEFEITDYDSDQTETLQLVMLNEGDIFGEIAFLEKNRRTATVKAVEETRVLKFDGGKLHEQLGANHSTGYRVMHNLAVILARRLTRLSMLWLECRA